MHKSVKRNYIFNLIYQIVVLLIPIISIPYLSRTLLETGVGTFSYCDSITSYFTLFAMLGISTYAQREIAKVQDNVEARSRLFWEMFIIKSITSIIAIAAYCIYLSLLTENVLISCVLIISIFNSLTDVTWFYQGIEEFGKVVIIGLIVKIISFVFIFIFIKSPDDVWLYAVSKTAFVLMGNLGMMCLVPKYLCRVKGIKPFKHLRVIISFFIPTIATQVYTMLDKSMIGWFTDSSAENGYYDYSEKIIKMCITVISALSTVLTPRVANAYVNGNKEEVKSLIYKAVRYVWLMAIPMMFGFLMLSDIFVPIYLGDNFAKSTTLLMIFAPLIVIVGMTNVIGFALLIPTDRQNVYIIAVIVAAVVNIILNIFLIPRYFSVGAAIASVAAETVGLIIQLVYVFKRKMVSIKTYFLSSIKYWLSGGVMAVSLYFLKMCIPSSILGLIALVVCGAVIYFVCLLALRDAFIYEAIKKIFGKVKRIFKRS